MYNNCLVIGAGGTGSHLIPSLARLLSYHPNFDGIVMVCDGDDFEDRNRERQHFTHSGNKAEAMVGFCRLLGLQGVHATTKYLSERNAKRILDGNSIVVACVDNDQTRKICCDHFTDTDQDFFFITPGNSTGDEIKVSVPYWGHIDGKTVGCNPALVYPNIENPADNAPTGGDCINQAPSQPQLITANAIAATTTLALLQNLLDGTLQPKTSAVHACGRTFKTSYA